MDDRWLSVEEIAEQRGVIKAAVRTWAYKHVPSNPVGRVWTFETGEVNDWVRAGGTKDFEVGEKG
jgi:hypothetical protein